MLRPVRSASTAAGRAARLAAGVLGVLLAVATPAGRAGWIEDAPGRTIVHVTLWELPDPSRTDTYTRAESAGVKEFTRRFPALFAERLKARVQADPGRYGRHDWNRVEVDLHPFSGITVEGVETDLLAIAGGVAPDVMYVNFRKSDTYTGQGFLYPLDKPADGYLASLTQEELDFRIHPKIWPVIRRKGPEGEKHVYALPYGGAVGKVLLYRKDLFDERGIPYPDKNWTWDDLYDACRKTTDPARGTYGMRLGRGKHESWFWTTFLWSAGGDVLAYDEPSDTWEAVFDSRNATLALDFYTRLCTEKWIDSAGKPRYGYACKESTTGSVKWDRGEIAMMFDYIDEKFFTSINPDLTGMCPVPLGPPVGPHGERIRGAELNSRMMGLFAGIREPLVRDVAWEYIRFYESRDAVEIKTRMMVEGGLGRFVNPKYLEMFGYDEVVRLAPRGWAETFEIALATGVPEPYGRHSNLCYDILTEPLQAAEEMALDGELPQAGEARLTVLQGLLRRAADKARKEMLGVVPPRVMLLRRVTAVVALLAMVAVFALVFRRIIATFTPTAVPGEKKGWQFRRFAWGYLMLLPALLSIFFWSYLPVARGSAMSLQDYRIMGGSSWIWLDNYANVIWNRDWWGAVWNSLRYSALVISLTFLPPVVLAVLLQEVPHGKILYRTLFYLPAVITGLVVVLLWKSFYEPSERGTLNAVVMRLPAIGFLAVGLVLFWVAFTFARRTWFHEMIGISGLFLAIGMILFWTCLAVASPIFTQAGVPRPLLQVGLTLLVPVILCPALLELPHPDLEPRLAWGAGGLLAVAGLLALGHAWQGPLARPLLQAIMALTPRALIVVAGATLLGLALGRASRAGAAHQRRTALCWALGGAGLFAGCLGLAEACAALQHGGTPWYAALLGTLSQPYRWLNDSDTAMLCCVMPMVWAGMGPGCLIYLAALKGIPEDFYEASDLDGATFVDKILFTVLPAIRPLLVINFVGVFIGSWYGAAGNILAMTGGGKNTEEVGLHIFYKAFVYLNFGEATAMAWLLGLMLIGFTVYQLRILSRLEFRATGQKPPL
jgi:multiple sugar transport system permease protein